MDILRILGFSFLALITSFSVHADLRIQRFVPELAISQEASLAEKEKMDGMIVAPKGLTCNLPSKDGFCTIPLVWLTNKDTPASLWRINEPPIRIAHAYDGVVEAYMRLDQSIDYELHDGADLLDSPMDSAHLTALWDDSWANNPPITSEMSLENEGACQIFSGEDHCKINLTWTAQNVTTASVWQRTALGPKLIIDRTLQGTLPVNAYEFSTVYELREGTTPAGELLSAAISKGYRINPEGTIGLPDGETCPVSDPNSACGLRVTWESNDNARLWLREKPLSRSGMTGQDVVLVGLEGAMVDLRAGSSPTGRIIDRTILAAFEGPYSGQFIGPGDCEIPYSDETCAQSVSFSTNADNATVWDDQNRVIAQGGSGSFIAFASQYGKTYYLRIGDNIDNQLLATYIAQGTKQPYNGTLRADSLSCVVNYQRGSCQLPIFYTATDRATVWDGEPREIVGGGSVNGQFNVSVRNSDGINETKNRFDLRIHGGATPRFTDPLLDQITLTAIRPEHEGTVEAVGNVHCNLLYSYDTCNVPVHISSTATLNSLWEAETNTLVWSGNSARNLSLTVQEGEMTYLLREGDHAQNDVLSSITLEARRPDYHMQLILPEGDSCVADEYSGSCTLAIMGEGNTSALIRYRDITTNPENSWSNLTSSSTRPSGTLNITGIRGSRTYEIEARHSRSPVETIDRLIVTADLGPVHSFNLTSIIPGSDGEPACTTFAGSSSCTATHPMTWDTTARRTTHCLRLDDGQVVGSGTYSAKNRSLLLNMSIDSGDRILDIYEGSVTCYAKNDTRSDGYRLLESVPIKGAETMQSADIKAEFRNDTAECNVNYQGYGSCTVDVTYDVDQEGNAHERGPMLYIRNSSGDFKSTLYTSFVQTSRITVIEGVKDQVFELRLSENGEMQESDLILDTVTVNHGYVDYFASAHLSRAKSQSSYAKKENYVRASGAPYYLPRKADGINYSNTSQNCTLHIDQEFCSVYLTLDTSYTRSGVSAFINGEFLESNTQNSSIYTSASKLDLPVGDYIIELYDGIGPEAKQNKRHDVFEFSVDRVPYRGRAYLETEPVVPHFDAIIDVRILTEYNTRAWLFDRSTGERVCSFSWPSYEMPNDRNSSCTLKLGVGDYTYDLKTASNFDDIDSVVLDSIEFSVTQKEQGIELFPHYRYPEYFDGCRLTFQQNSCIIYHNYTNNYDSDSSQSISFCAVNPEKDLISKRSSGIAIKDRNDYQQYTSLTMYEGESEFWVADGPACPSSISDDSIPILLKKHISLEEAVIDVETSLSGTGLVEREAGGYYCIRAYEGGTCSFSINASINNPNTPGQPHAGVISLYQNKNPLGASVSKNPHKVHDNVSRSTSFYGMAIDAEPKSIETVLCERLTYDMTGCPYREDRVLNTIQVYDFLPEYSAQIDAPDGNRCEAAYGSNSCTIRIKASTDSGRVSIFRDGVLIETFNDRSDVDKTFTFQVSENDTINLVIRDGGSLNGRELASMDVFARPYNPERFSFLDISHNCVFSFAVLSERPGSCQAKIEYTSDDSVKYIYVNSTKYEVSGNGHVIADLNGSVNLPGQSWSPSQARVASLNVYSDESKSSKSLMASENINQNISRMLDNYFGEVVGMSAQKSNAKTSSSYNSYYGLVTYYMNGTVIHITNPINVDDIVLKSWDGCSGSHGYDGFSALCGSIKYMQTNISIPSDSVKSGEMKHSSTNYHAKRLFYKVANPNVAENLIDPVVTVDGVARPILMDGEWHYIEIDNKSAFDIEISAGNVSNVSTNLTMHWFAELL